MDGVSTEAPISAPGQSSGPLTETEGSGGEGEAGEQSADMPARVCWDDDETNAVLTAA